MEFAGQAASLHKAAHGTSYAALRNGRSPEVELGRAGEKLCGMGKHSPSLQVVSSPTYLFLLLLQLTLCPLPLVLELRSEVCQLRLVHALRKLRQKVLPSAAIPPEVLPVFCRAGSQG